MRGVWVGHLCFPLLAPSQAPPAGRRAPLDPAQREEAQRLAAGAAASVPSHATLYPGLPGLEPAPLPPRLGKQLHSGWVASHQSRPEMGDLWSAADQQRGVCSTRPVSMYVRPSAKDVARVLLAL